MKKVTREQFNEIVKGYNDLMYSSDKPFDFSSLDNDPLFCDLRDKNYTTVYCNSSKKDKSPLCWGLIDLIGIKEYRYKMYCEECKKHNRKQAIIRYQQKKQIAVEIKKICPICGEEFFPQRASKKTCSDKCRKQASLKNLDIPMGMTKTKLREIEEFKMRIEKQKGYIAMIPEIYSNPQKAEQILLTEKQRLAVMLRELEIMVSSQ